MIDLFFFKFRLFSGIDILEHEPVKTMQGGFYAVAHPDLVLSLAVLDDIHNKNIKRIIFYYFPFACGFFVQGSARTDDQDENSKNGRNFFGYGG